MAARPEHQRPPDRRVDVGQLAGGDPPIGWDEAPDRYLDDTVKLVVTR